MWNRDTSINVTMAKHFRENRIPKLDYPRMRLDPRCTGNELKEYLVRVLGKKSSSTLTIEKLELVYITPQESVLYLNEKQLDQLFASPDEDIIIWYRLK